MLCGEEGHPYWSTHFQHQTIWQLLARDEKSIPALKIYIFRDMADSILYLIPHPPNPVQKYQLSRLGGCMWKTEGGGERGERGRERGLSNPHIEGL